MIIASEILLRIIEGAMEGDIRKVRAYSILIAGNLEHEGDIEGAKVINSRLDGSYRDNKSNEEA